MVNTQYLEELIEESGKKKSFLADKCGISIQTLRRKSRNEGRFDSDEIEVLCRELGVKSLRDKERLFFAQNVDV